MKNQDRLSSLFFVVFSILILSQALKLPFGTINHPDSGFFPAIIAVLLLSLSLALLGKSLFNGTEKPVEWGHSYTGIGLTVATTVLYAFFINFLGYLLCTLLAGIILMKAVQKRSWRIAFFFSILFSAISYFGFKMVGVLLPQGIIYFF
jgi:hypothetical protein